MAGTSVQGSGRKRAGLTGAAVELAWRNGVDEQRPVQLTAGVDFRAAVKRAAFRADDERRICESLGYGARMSGAA